MAAISVQPIERVSITTLIDNNLDVCWLMPARPGGGARGDSGCGGGKLANRGWQDGRLGLFETITPETVAALATERPAVVVPAHCTGWKAMQQLAAELPGAYIPSSVGSSYEL